MTPFLTGGQPGFALTGLLCADSRNQFFSRVVSPARSVLRARARWLRVRLRFGSCLRSIDFAAEFWLLVVVVD